MKHKHAQGVKCDDSCPEAVVIVGDYTEPEPEPPYGGARTFAEVDSYLISADAQADISDILSVFQCLQQCILDDDDLTPADRASALVALAEELRTRLAAPETGNPYDVAEAADKAEGRSWAFWRRTRTSAKATIAPVALAIEAAAAADKHGAEDLDGTVMFKQSPDGTWRWLIVASNNRVDDDREAFSRKSWQGYVDRFDQKLVQAECRLWHEKAARLGPCDMVDLMTEGFVVASGTVDPGMERIAENLSHMKDLGCSHGYTYRLSDYRLDRKDGVGIYDAHSTFEFSILPRLRGANKLTRAQVTEGTATAMGMTHAKKEFLVAAGYSPEAVDNFETAVGQLDKEASDKGIAFKDVADALVPSGKAAAGHAAGCSAPNENSPAFLHSADCPQSAKKDDATTDVLAGVKAALDEAIKPLSDAQTAQGARIDQLAETVKELGISADERLANMIANARRGPLAAASASPDTVINGNSKDAKDARAGASDKGLADVVDAANADGQKESTDRLAFYTRTMTGSKS